MDTFNVGDTVRIKSHPAFDAWTNTISYINEDSTFNISCFNGSDGHTKWMEKIPHHQLIMVKKFEY